jgi:hypothetical protein
MPLSGKAHVLYKAIVSHCERNPGTVVTYGQLEMTTGIAAITQALPLGEIFEACDAKGLPPLTSIVVQQGTATPDGRYGIPGDGYILADEASANRTRRNKDADVNRRIRRHQDSVHDFGESWPERL